jgi:hypothetical protein
MPVEETEESKEAAALARCSLQTLQDNIRAAISFTQLSMTSRPP